MFFSAGFTWGVTTPPPRARELSARCPVWGGCTSSCPATSDLLSSYFRSTHGTWRIFCLHGVIIYFITESGRIMHCVARGSVGYLSASFASPFPFHFPTLSRDTRSVWDDERIVCLFLFLFLFLLFFAYLLLLLLCILNRAEAGMAAGGYKKH